jgi:hypothetical protein
MFVKNVFLLNYLIKNVFITFIVKIIKNICKKCFFIKLYVKKCFATFFNCFNKKML